MFRLLIPVLLLATVSAQAQTTMTYRLVRIDPNGAVWKRGPDGEMLWEKVQPLIRFTSTMTITSRDSAGGTIWELVRDAGIAEYIQSDSTYPATPTPPGSGLQPAPMARYRAFQRGAEVTAVNVTSNNAPLTLAIPDDPRTSLLLVAASMTGSITARGVPTTVGASVVDTITKAGRMTQVGNKDISTMQLDTTEVVWRKPMATTLTLNEKRQSVRVPGPGTTGSMAIGGTTLTSVTATLQFDAQQLLLEINQKTIADEHPDVTSMGQGRPLALRTRSLSLKRVP